VLDRQHVDVLIRRATDQRGRFQLGGRLENLFNAGRISVIGEETLRDVRLLVQIDNQAPECTLLTDGGEQPAKVCFAHATFQVERCDDLCSARLS